LIKECAKEVLLEKKSSLNESAFEYWYNEKEFINQLKKVEKAFPKNTKVIAALNTILKDPKNRAFAFDDDEFVKVLTRNGVDKDWVWDNF